MSSWKTAKELNDPELGFKKGILDIRQKEETGEIEYLIANVDDVKNFLTTINSLKKQKENTNL